MSKQRKEINDKYKWDLSKIYSSLDDVNKDIEVLNDVYKTVGRLMIPGAYAGLLNCNCNTERENEKNESD